MGDDADVCVVSFKVSGKQPSADLVSFIEKGYDYVLDADVSSGEKEGGDYLVFVEIARAPALPEQIFQMIQDILNLSEQSIEEWRVRYYKSTEDHALSVETLQRLIPLSAEKYNSKYGVSDDESNDEETAHSLVTDLDKLKTAAGVKVDTVAPKNDFTESLRIAAGIR